MELSVFASSIEDIEIEEIEWNIIPTKDNFYI
jgi:hypothetical protein